MFKIYPLCYLSILYIFLTGCSSKEIAKTPYGTPIITLTSILKPDSSLERCALEIFKGKGFAADQITLLSSTGDEVRASIEICEPGKPTCEPGADCQCARLREIYVVNPVGDTCVVIIEERLHIPGVNLVPSPTVQPTSTSRPTPTRTRRPTSQPIPSPTPTLDWSKTVKYQIQPGDRLITISEEFNISLDELVNANQSPNGGFFTRVGDTLTIPCNICDDVVAISTSKPPGIPEIYKPHPALIYIAPQEPYSDPSRWVNDNQFMLMEDYVKNEGGGCSLGVWDVYNVQNNENEPVKLTSFQTQCVPSMHIDEDEFPLIPEIEALEEKYFIETWAEDNIHFIGIGSCYDLVGSGFFSYDIETRTIHWINDYDRACEGELFPLISPDSGHILYRGMVFTIHGEKQGDICRTNETARSYAWSPDGRYAYVSCGTANGDVLRRFDTTSGKQTRLTEYGVITFKAIELYPSPGGSYLLFQWGDNYMDNQEPFGLWLLDLKKLRNE